MTGRVETADGKVYELPALLEWQLRRTGGVPCDSFRARCLYSAEMGEALKAACRFAATENGERVLVIKGGTLGEERYVAGSLDAAREQDDLGDGEVRIYAEDGGASITLRRNGHVEIEGDLFINGAMYVPPVS